MKRYNERYNFSKIKISICDKKKKFVDKVENFAI